METVLKIGGLYKFRHLSQRMSRVWASTDSRDEKLVCHLLAASDLFVVIEAGDLYYKILVAKNSQCGYIVKSQLRFSELVVEQVEEPWV